MRRARYGDRRAARRLAARYLPRVSLLAAVVAPGRAAAAAREGFALALHQRGAFEDALQTAFGQLAARAPDPEHAQGRLVVLLVDLEHRPLAHTARLLGLTVAAADERRALAGSITGALVVGKACRGWGLASGGRDLTPSELEVGEAHLALCRRCRERRAAVEKEQRELLTRAAGVATALGVADAAALVLAPAGVLAGKAAIGVIGALGATALATGGLVVSGAAPFGPGPAHVVPPAQVSCGPACPTAGASGTSSTTPVPVPSPAGTPLVSPGLRLPSGPGRLDVPAGASVPALPLPSSLLPLPTSVPLPLPSSVTVLPSTSPVPLPPSLDLPQLLP